MRFEKGKSYLYGPWSRTYKCLAVADDGTALMQWSLVSDCVFGVLPQFRNSYEEVV